MVQGTYSQLCSSGLDVVSLLSSSEEQERLSQSADPDKLSLVSQRTKRSHSSHCSQSSLLPPESNLTDQLPVGAFLYYVFGSFVFCVQFTLVQFRQACMSNIPAERERAVGQ